MIYFCDDRLTIRDISDIAEMRQLEQMQADVWGITDRSEIVPKDILKIVQVNGGLILGAYDQKLKLVGFLFGFVGLRPNGQIKHCSHMMGILPSNQASGIGLKLKMAQREFVLSQGIDLITWTVNPLEGANASVNFAKLGVVCQNYLPNFYGEMDDTLNKGFPSHRFEVEWWIRSPRVVGFMEFAISGKKPKRSISEDDVRVNRIENDGEITEILSPGQVAHQTARLVYEVPVDFQTVKRNNIFAARKLLEHNQLFFMEALKQGYVVSDFASITKNEVRRNYYFLERDLDFILKRPLVI